MKFSIISNDSNSLARTGLIENDHGKIHSPVFMPVGTIGAVKTFSPFELADMSFEIKLGNTYHLYLRPGTDILQSAGGLHQFMNWNKIILTDSGGFQIYSLANFKINCDNMNKTQIVEKILVFYEN